MLLYRKRSLTTFSPIIHTTLSLRAPLLIIGKVQKLAVTFVKVFQHVLALQQLRLFSLTHWQVNGGVISMFKITHGLPKLCWVATFAQPTRQELCGHNFKVHQPAFSFPRSAHITHPLQQLICHNRTHVPILTFTDHLSLSFIVALTAPWAG